MCSRIFILASVEKAWSYQRTVPFTLHETLVSYRPWPTWKSFCSLACVPRGSCQTEMCRGNIIPSIRTAYLWSLDRCMESAGLERCLPNDGKYSMELTDAHQIIILKFSNVQRRGHNLIGVLMPWSSAHSSTPLLSRHTTSSQNILWSFRVSYQPHSLTHVSFSSFAYNSFVRQFLLCLSPIVYYKVFIVSSCQTYGFLCHVWLHCEPPGS